MAGIGSSLDSGQAYGSPGRGITTLVASLVLRRGATDVLETSASMAPLVRSPESARIVPLTPARSASFALIVRASAQGTSDTAMRSTIAGSGSVSPLAAQIGTGKQIPSRARARCHRTVLRPAGANAREVYEAAVMLRVPP